jgi:uncharacterized delta-60 repeat protein
LLKRSIAYLGHPTTVMLHHRTSTLALLLTCAATSLLAQEPGDLDTGFGTNGTVITGFIPESIDEATGIAVQADGRIILRGSSLSNQGGAAMVRYLPSGALDPSFGTGGRVVINVEDSLFVSGDRSVGIALQSDGKILTTETAYVNGQFRGVVLRFLANGALDASFGGDGIVMDASESIFNTVHVQADGRILVAGLRVFPGTGSGLAARFMPDGSPDATYGTNGHALLSIPGMSVENIRGAALQPDGRLLVAGRVSSGPFMDHLLVRFTEAGQLDASFGAGGRVISSFSPLPDWAGGIDLQPDGRILAGVTLQDPLLFNSIGVARFLPNGNLDASFGTGGFATVSTAFDAWCWQPVVMADGRIAVGLQAGGQLAVAMLQDNGALDAGFSGDGIATTTAGLYQRNGAIAAQSDGKLLLAGAVASTGPPDEVDMVLHRMHTRLSLVGIEERSVGLTGYHVVPNPFRETPLLEFILDSPQQLTLRLVDATGREVMELRQRGLFAAGRHRIPLHGTETLPAGQYHIIADGASGTASFTVTKE